MYGIAFLWFILYQVINCGQNNYTLESNWMDIYK